MQILAGGQAACERKAQGTRGGAAAVGARARRGEERRETIWSGPPAQGVAPANGRRPGGALRVAGLQSHDCVAASRLQPSWPAPEGAGPDLFAELRLGRKPRQRSPPGLLLPGGMRRAASGLRTRGRRRSQAKAVEEAKGLGGRVEAMRGSFWPPAARGRGYSEYRSPSS